MARRVRRQRGNRTEFKRRSLPGAPPGVLVPDPAAAPSHMTVMAYGPDSFEERSLSHASEIKPLLDRFPVTWINVDGLADTSLIGEIGQLFGFHRLALEDVVHNHQRAKVEQYGSTYFVVARMPLPDGSGTEQISMFLGANYIVTFQEIPGDCLDPVRLRIRTGIGQVRRSGPDCLLYALLDTIIDQYFPLVEEAGDRLDDLEEDILSRLHQGVSGRLHGVKRKLLTIRRAMWPLRDAVNSLIRDETPLLKPETRVYLRDCHDHTVQIIDLVESYRDIASGLHDVYLSIIGQRTNEIMRVLTVISTVFMPLTFIVGIYGMNFDPSVSPWNLPETKWYWGYPLVMGVMAAVAIWMLLFFRRKGWLGSESTVDPPAHLEQDESGGRDERS